MRTLALPFAVLAALAALAVSAAAPAARADAPPPAAAGPGASPQAKWGALPAAPPVVEKREVELRVDGAVAARVNAAALAKVKPLPQHGNGGKSTLYGLKDVVGALVAPGARVTTVHLAGGASVPVDEKAWADAARTPVIWQNRRGLFKLGWVDAKGRSMGTSMELRDVRALDVVTPKKR